MGRELKRVPMDFDWPLDKVWRGYINPYWLEGASRCPDCDGSGYNAGTHKLQLDWYTHGNTERKEGWQYHLEQEEVDALLEKGRLRDLTGYPTNKEQAVIYKELEEHKGDSDEARIAWANYNNGYKPTAEEVNAWAKKDRCSGHDSINQWICVEVRAKKLGVWGKCDRCKGEGQLWKSEEIKRKYEEWEETDPPVGEGFQLWETTSEGSPQSPVFGTLEELCRWCEKNATTFVSYKATKEKWMKMLDDGFVSHQEGSIIFI